MTEKIKRRRATIAISKMLCKSCGLCVEFCPKGVFGLDAGEPLVEHEEKCTGCGICELLCPDFAIELEAVDS